MLAMSCCISHVVKLVFKGSYHEPSGAPPSEMLAMSSSISLGLVASQGQAGGEKRTFAFNPTMGNEHV